MHSPAENGIKMNTDNIDIDQEISSEKVVIIPPEVKDVAVTGEDVSNKDEEVFDPKDESTAEPVKRGRGRPRKSLNKPDDTTINQPSKEPEPISIQESNSTKPKDTPSHVKQHEDKEMNKEETDGIFKETSSNLSEEKIIKDDVTLINQDSKEMIKTDVPLKKIIFGSLSNQDTDLDTLESEFEFNAVGSIDNDVSEEKDYDSSSEYEDDSDDELEIIEEIIVEEPSEKTLDVSGVKLEPKELVEKSRKQVTEGDQGGSRPISETVIKQAESMLDVVEPEDKKKHSPTPSLEDEEDQLQTTKNVFLYKVENNLNEKTSKRKMEMLKSEELYQPVMFDVQLPDIAQDRAWRLQVEPQVRYFKRRAAVIHRWENDIQAYFKQRS